MWERFRKLPAVYQAGALFIVLMLVSMLFAWYDKGDKADPGKFTPAPPISGTAGIPKETKKAPKGVTIIPKGPLGGKVDLPPEVITDPDVEVTATAKAPPSESGTDILSTYNFNTGDTKIVTKPSAQSLFGFENKRRIGVGYGVGTDGTSAKLFGEYTFLRVGSMHLGAQAEIVANPARAPEAKASAVLDYRW